MPTWVCALPRIFEDGMLHSKAFSENKNIVTQKKVISTHHLFSYTSIFIFVSWFLFDLLNLNIVNIVRHAKKKMNVWKSLIFRKRVCQHHFHVHRYICTYTDTCVHILICAQIIPKFSSSASGLRFLAFRAWAGVVLLWFCFTIV